MKIEIFINDNWQDISNNIQSKSLNFTEQANQVLEVGSFEAILDIANNIPPYTPLRIDSSYYVCSSESNKHMLYENKYYHIFSVLKAESVLALFQIGTKYFSITGNNVYDYDKIRILCELTEYKYGIKLNYSHSNFANINGKKEYLIADGMTLYDALLMILSEYDYLPTITKIDNNKTFYIGCRPIKDESNITNFSDLKIISNRCTQNVENYCNTIEGKMPNVVDRTNRTKIKYLSLRSADEQLTEDKAILQLPFNVEEITDLGLEVQGDWELEYFEIQSIPTNWFNRIYVDGNAQKVAPTIGTDSNGNYRWYDENGKLDSFNDSRTLDYAMSVICEVESEYDGGEENWYVVRTPLSSWYNNLKNELPGCENLEVFLAAAQSGKVTLKTSGIVSMDIVEFEEVSYKEHIIEQTAYQALEAKDRPKYCYYKTGGNTVEGLYNRYKDDFWNGLLGQTVTSFLEHQGKTVSKFEQIYDGSDNATGVFEKYKLSVGFNNDILKLLFYVECIPAMSLYMSSKKTGAPLNEAYYKPSSKSYDVGANTIDFDRLVNSIDTKVNMVGLPEKIIEVKGHVGKAGGFLLIDNKKWYIQSITRTLSFYNWYSVLNLVENYTMVPDCIGVKSQFEVTSNPLNAIIDRYVEVEATRNYTPGNQVYLKMSNTRGNDIIVPCAYYNHNNTTYYVCEMLDQYSAGKSANVVDLNKNYYYVKDVPYCDYNNEYVGNCTISLIEITNKLTIGQSHALPILSDGITYNTIAEATFPLYKDGRERIIFSVKLK